jgi:ketosteroid isomerase-like protein
MDPVDAVHEIFALIDQQRTDELIECFAADAVMELPFAPGKMPKAYRGRDEVYGFMSFVRDAFSSFSMTVDAVHRTLDASVVIVEHHADGVVAENGRTYDNRYITLIRFDDAGNVALWREYYDAGVVVRAFRPG